MENCNEVLAFLLLEQKTTVSSVFNHCLILQLNCVKFFFTILFVAGLLECEIQGDWAQQHVFPTGVVLNYVYGYLEL